jgi:hypothetical protein
MASLHGQAWSEPLFLPLCFGSLFALSEYLREPRSRWLLASAGLAAAAVLTRYVGLALVLTSMLLIASRGRARWRNLLMFSGIALAPLAAWAVRNAVVAEPALGHRTLAWHPIGVAQLGQLAYTLLDWFLPNQVAARLVSSGGTFSPIGAVALVVLAAAAVAVLARVRLAQSLQSLQSLHPLVSRVLPVFVGAYVATVLVAASAFDHRIQVDSRTLSPVFVALTVWLGAGTARLTQQHSLPRMAVAGVASLLLVISGGRLAATTQRAHAEGISYSSTKYLSSVVTDRVRQLPVDAAIYSNAPDAIYLLTARQAFALPDVTTFGETMALLEQQLRQQRPVYVAQYSDPDIAYRQLDPAHLEPDFALELRDADATGRLYELRR